MRRRCAWWKAIERIGVEVQIFNSTRRERRRRGTAGSFSPDSRRRTPVRSAATDPPFVEPGKSRKAWLTSASAGRKPLAMNQKQFSHRTGSDKKVSLGTNNVFHSY